MCIECMEKFHSGYIYLAPFNISVFPIECTSMTSLHAYKCTSMTSLLTKYMVCPPSFNTEIVAEGLQLGIQLHTTELPYCTHMYMTSLLRKYTVYSQHGTCCSVPEYKGSAVNKVSIGDGRKPCIFSFPSVASLLTPLPWPLPKDIASFTNTNISCS